MYSEPFDPNEILVKASPLEQAVSASVPVTGVGGGEITPEYLPKEDIVVDATKIEQPTPVSGGFNLSPDTVADVDKAAAEEAEKKKNLGVKDYIDIAALLAGLIPDGKGGSNQTGTYGGGGTGRLNPIFSAKLPSAGGLGTIGASRTVRPMSDEDWLTYGTRPEKSFFDYAPQAATALPTPITTPVPNLSLIHI